VRLFAGYTIALLVALQYSENNEHTYIHPFSGPLSRTTRVSRYQKGKTNLDFAEARDSECLGISWAICNSASRSRQINMPASHHSILQAGCPSCHPTNSVKALKAVENNEHTHTRLTALCPGLPG